MASLITRSDWRSHPLGLAGGWPRALDLAVRTILASKQAMWMGWGSDLACIYNDACIPLLGTKHPAALGRPVEEVWPEVGASALGVLREGRATQGVHQVLLPARDGGQEETYYTFSCSPAPDDHGGIGGVLCVMTDSTSRLISERRADLIRDLGIELRGANTEERVFAALSRCLAARPHDVPLGVAYLFDRAGGGVRARLACAHGVAADSVLAPRQLDPLAWPVRELLDSPDDVLLKDISQWLPAPPAPPRATALSSNDW